MILLTLLLALFGTTQTRAQGVPPGCSGSAIGISLFTSAPDVHIGDTITYSISVFNGIAGNPTSCDASNIQASDRRSSTCFRMTSSWHPTARKHW